MKTFPVVCALIAFCAGETAIAETSWTMDFDEMMIRATVKIHCGDAVGSGFILGLPSKIDTNCSHIVLVTAAHVLGRMPSNNVSVSLRIGEKSDYRKLDHTLPIRAYGTNLWAQHPTADVAAMCFGIPAVADLKLISSKILAEDKFFDDFRIHPGDEVRVLGFPYGVEANNAGFPVLRSGRIASYPLTPSASYPTFMIDFRVFPGNSGGPVYIIERRAMQEGSLDSVTVRSIVGLVSEEVAIQRHIITPTEQSIRKFELGLGVVVPARFIRETLEMVKQQ